MPRKQPCENTDLDEIFHRIRARSREISFAIKVQSKVDRSLHSFVAVNLFGYIPLKDDKAAKDVFAKAAKRIKDAAEDETDVLHSIVSAANLSRQPFDKIRADAELDLKHLVRALPVWNGWGKDVKGIGEIALGRILGETGNLSNYATVSKVWKRLGLAVHDGHRQGNPGKGATAEDWIVEGYSPSRRSIVYVASESLFKHQGVGKDKSDTGEWKPSGPYGEVYAARRAHTAVTHPDWTPAHSMKDAMRVMSKKLIADLWSAWRAAIDVKPRGVLPAT